MRLGPKTKNNLNMEATGQETPSGQVPTSREHEQKIQYVYTICQ
jgi:hypothetical protein